MSFSTLAVLPSASTGTGTTKTELLSGGYIIPSGVNFIEKIGWYQAPTAAVTAAESTENIAFLESDDVANIIPKRYAIPPIMGGLSTVWEAHVPMINWVPVNVPVKPQQRLRFWGQSTVANTAAMRIGANMVQKPVQNGLQQLYFDVPFSSGNPASTSSGTGAARVATTAITVTEMAAIVGSRATVYPAVITASESYCGYLEVLCDGFAEATPYTHSIQPIGAGIGATISIGIPADTDIGVDPLETKGAVYRRFKSRATNTITPYYIQEEALTAAATVIPQLFMVK